MPAGDHKFAITKIPKLIFSTAQYKYILEIPFGQLHVMPTSKHYFFSNRIVLNYVLKTLHHLPVESLDKIGPWTDILTCHIKSIL